MPEINKAVGAGKPNEAADVAYVQERLGQHRAWLGSVPWPSVSGVFDEATRLAIIAFQENGAALLKGDGSVSPNGYTIKALAKAVIPQPSHAVFRPMCWARSGGLTDADFTTAATTLGCEVAAIRAVARVETKRSAWDELGRPTILFERHYFARLSGNLYSRTHPDISNSVQGGYGKFSAQYPKLTRAAILDERAALKSASWGMFQIMGANFSAAGYASVEAFVDGMLKGEGAHLSAFVAFIGASPAMKKALVDKDWATFARMYNGPGYAKNNYDTEMKNAYDALKPK